MSIPSTHDTTAAQLRELASPWWTKLHAPQIILGVILGVAALARGFQLGANTLWFDEAIIWKLTRFPWGEMIPRVACDNNPPLYHLLVKTWSQVFGTSELALRSVSLIFGVLTVMGVYLFATVAFRDETTSSLDEGRWISHSSEMALLAAGLTAVSVFHIYWSRQVRMYSLGTALLAFSSWALFRALRDSRQRFRLWIEYAVITLLFVYTHTFALFSVAAQALFLAGQVLNRHRLRRTNPCVARMCPGAALAGALVFVGWLPWMSALLQQRQQVRHEFWTPAVTWQSVADSCCKMFLEPERTILAVNSVPRSLSVTIALLCAACLLALLWRGKSAEWYVFLAAAGPFGMSILVSLGDTRIFYVRYLIFAHLFLLVAVAALIARIREPVVRLLLACIILLDLAYPWVASWGSLYAPDHAGERTAVRYLDARRNADEAVIVCDALRFPSLLYYTGVRPNWFVYSQTGRVVHYHGAAALTPNQIIQPEQIRALSTTRLWVVDVTFSGGNWQRVPLPGDWESRTEETFPTVHGPNAALVVREYQRGTSR